MSQSSASSSIQTAAPLDGERERLADELLQVLPRLKRRFEASLPADLREELATVTPYQIEALCHLSGGAGVTMHALARAQGCGLSSATSLADRLLRQGLARRIADQEDRRVVRLVPTERAAVMVERFRASRRRTVLNAVANLEEKEIRQLIELLRRVAGEEEVDG